MLQKEHNKKNIIWINTAKALCMLFVFLYHAEWYLDFRLLKVDGFYHPFYINCFFFLSGYLLFRKQLSQPVINEGLVEFERGGGRLLLSNIICRIAIPSILFSLIEFFPKKIIRGEGIDFQDMVFETIGGGTYWFTSALVVAELVLLLLLLTRNRSIWFYVTACFILGLLGMEIVKHGILNSGIWAWRQGLISLLFIGLGGMYWRYEKQIDKMMKWWFVLSLLLMYIVMVIGLKGYNDPLICTLTIQPLGLITSAFACMMLVWLCKKLPDIKLLSFIGLNSLGFYFLSGALPNIYSILFSRITGLTMTSILLIVFVSSILTAYSAILVLTKYFPWVFDIRLLRK